MPKSRDQKEAIVQEIADKFGRMKSAVFTKISGYTMDDANALRAEAKKGGMEVFIAKKTLLDLAAKSAGLEGIDLRHMEGSVLTVVGYEDEVGPAKMMAKFVKGRETMSFVGGILENKGIEASMVTSLSKLPGKQELLGQLVGTLNAPISGFVNVLAGNLRGLVNVLNAVKDKKPA